MRNKAGVVGAEGGAGAGDAHCPTIAAAAPRRALHCASLVALFSPGQHRLRCELQKPGETWTMVHWQPAIARSGPRTEQCVLEQVCSNFQAKRRRHLVDAKRTTISPASSNQSTK